MGRISDLDEVYPKKWCPVCREHVAKIVVLDSLDVWIGNICNIEDWACGQGFTPFPAQPPTALREKGKIEYPKIPNGARKAEWVVNRSIHAQNALELLTVKRRTQ